MSRTGGKNGHYPNENCKCSTCYMFWDVKHELSECQSRNEKLNESLEQALADLTRSRNLVHELLEAKETKNEVYNQGSENIGVQDNTSIPQLSAIWKYLGDPTDENLYAAQKVIYEPLKVDNFQTISRDLLMRVHTLNTEKRQLNVDLTTAANINQQIHKMVKDLMVNIDQKVKNKWFTFIRGITAAQEFVNQRLHEILERSNKDLTIGTNSVSTVQQNIAKFNANESKPSALPIQGDSKQQQTLNQSVKLQKDIVNLPKEYEKLQKLQKTLEGNLKQKNECIKEIQNKVATAKQALQESQSEKIAFEKSKLEELDDLKMQHSQECVNLESNYNDIILTKNNLLSNIENQLRCSNDKISDLLMFKENILTLEKNSTTAYQIKQKEFASTLNDYTKLLSITQIKDSFRTSKICHIEQIQKNVKCFEHEIFNLRGGNNQSFLHAKEMLLRALEQLDKVTSNGDTNIQASREKAILYVQHLHNMLVNKQ